MFDHVWFWKSRLPGRKGHVCRVLARGRMNSILVEFPDGYKVVTSRNAVRLLTMRAPDGATVCPYCETYIIDPKDHLVCGAVA